ncbi:MAG: histidine phosphatase family protein [Candidatus Shapirobacteria bacterium]
MKLILVRHGESEANANNVLQGIDGGKLTKKGIDQAKNLGKELKEKYKIDMIFCSPLNRCMETLEAILSEYPIEGQILISKLIEERDFGEYTGVETHLINWKEVDEDNKINEELGVESLANLKKRANLFLEDLKLEDKDSTILVVSHHGPIRMMISILTGENFEEIKVENASIIEFEIEETDYSK